MPTQTKVKKIGDKFVEESGFVVGMTELAGLSALFGSITFFENFEKVIETFKIWANVLFGILGAAKVFAALIAAYELIRLTEEQYREKCVALGKEFDEEKYQEERAYAWLKLISNAVQAFLVGVAIFGGTFAAIATIAVAAPPIFLAVGALGIVYDISQIYRYRNGLKAAYSYYVSGKKERFSPEEQHDWNMVKTHAWSAFIGAAIIAVVAIAIMSAPFSFPAIGMIGAGIIGTFVAYKVVKKIYNWCTAPKTVNEEQQPPTAPIHSINSAVQPTHNPLHENSTKNSNSSSRVVAKTASFSFPRPVTKDNDDATRRRYSLNDLSFFPAVNTTRSYWMLPVSEQSGRVNQTIHQQSVR